MVPPFRVWVVPRPPNLPLGPLPGAPENSSPPSGEPRRFLYFLFRPRPNPRRPGPGPRFSLGPFAGCNPLYNNGRTTGLAWKRESQGSPPEEPALYRTIAPGNPRPQAFWERTKNPFWKRVPDVPPSPSPGRFRGFAGFFGSSAAPRFPLFCGYGPFVCPHGWVAMNRPRGRNLEKAPPAGFRHESFPPPDRPNRVPVDFSPSGGAPTLNSWSLP